MRELETESYRHERIQKRCGGRRQCLPGSRHGRPGRPRSSQGESGENYQKRAQRDLAQERRYAHGPLAHDLLPIFDNFERALAAARQAGETGPLVQGVTMVQSQILDILKRHGITRIEALGQPFDPNLHEAVSQQPSNEKPNTVLQVLENGFMIHDRVLRPARVIVSVPAKER